MNSNWHLSKGTQVSMWVILLLVSLLLFLGGRETAGSKVRDNQEGINILTIKIEQNCDNIKEIKESLEKQRDMLHEIHTKLLDLP